MSRSQQTGTGVSWEHPLGPLLIDAERWAEFCAEIDGRIDRVREDEGHTPWRTFGSALRRSVQGGGVRR